MVVDSRHAPNLTPPTDKPPTDRRQSTDGLTALTRKVISLPHEALLGLGWEALPSETNFLWLPTGEASESVAALWERRGLLVRAFPRTGLRVTVGSPDVNDLLITAAKETAPPAR